MTQIRSGLNTALSAISGVQTSAYMLDAPVPPLLQVMGPEVVEYDDAMQRGLDTYTVVVQAFAGTPEQQAAQDTVDAWLAPSGSSSVKAAVESDITLGGIVASARVVRANGYRIYDLPHQGRTLGCEFFVEIYNQK